MSKIAGKHLDQLDRIRENIENSYVQFDENYKRYNDFRNFVFVTTQSDNELSLLTQLKKPKVEFNVLEAYISRLRGEFSKHEPSVKCSAKDGKDVDPKVLDVVESHVRYILQEANKSGLEYHCYTDTLSGGFSAMKIFTEYTGEMSFHQDIKMRRVFDPTLVGFDPLATKEDKSDGEFCFEIFPMRKIDFERDYPGIQLDNVNFTKNIGPFNWSFKVNRDEMLLVADYYEKKKIKKSIVMLSDGQVMTTTEYDEFIERWMADGKIEQPPAIIGKPRTTTIVKIVRYKVIENQIFDYEETDFRRLPIIFIDGNSILSKENGTGTVRQFTRPYIYNARGAQKLKNFCGQTLANEIENMGPSKLIVAKDAIPPAYLDAYVNPQQAVIYIYNAFKNDNVDVPLPAPMPMPRPQIPPEISNAFMGADQLIQNVLGSFDATMSKITTEQVSGVAIQESATLSNASSMPYVVSFLRGLQSAAQSAVDLIPLYYRTPRTIPVISQDGHKSYVKINQDGGIMMDYDNDALEINVEAGVSFNLQKSRALQQIIALMNASPMFAQFINESGIDIILDNVEIHGIESLRERAEAWMQQLQQQKEQMAQKPNPEEQAIQVMAQQVQSEHELGMQKIQLSAMTEQTKAQLKQQELENDKQKLMLELAKAISESQFDKAKLNIDRQRADDERINSLVDASIKASEHHHDNLDKQFDRNMKIIESMQAKEMEESPADEAMEDIAKGE